MEPVLIPKLLDEIQYQDLIDNVPDFGTGLIDLGRSRHLAENPFITAMGKSLEPVAKEVFGSNTLKSTYSLYCMYYGQASMEMHRDDNACTYTIDLCLRQSEPWQLIIEGIGYFLFDNQALCYLGNDQEHGRKPKDFGQGGFVEMVFFHFAEPEHPFFSTGNELSF